MESCFSMTEPDNAGSDPRSIKTTAKKDGDHWVINGHKVMTSNGIRADFAIVMCRTEEEDGSGGVNSRMSQIIVHRLRGIQYCSISSYMGSYRGRSRRN